MNKWISTGLGRLRLVTFLEGLSWLILLFIAMPLKYGLDKPEMVKLVGTAHGILFVLFLFLLLIESIQHNWKFGRSLGLFIASLIPFGFIYADRKWLQTTD